MWMPKTWIHTLAVCGWASADRWKCSWTAVVAVGSIEGWDRYQIIPEMWEGSRCWACCFGLWICCLWFFFWNWALVWKEKVWRDWLCVKVAVPCLRSFSINSGCCCLARDAVALNVIILMIFACCAFVLEIRRWERGLGPQIERYQRVTGEVVFPTMGPVAQVASWSMIQSQKAWILEHESLRASPSWIKRGYWIYWRHFQIDIWNILTSKNHHFFCH